VRKNLPLRCVLPLRCRAPKAKAFWFGSTGSCSDRSSNNPVGQQKLTCWLTSQPVSYSASPLLSIRKITLFGKWPTLLGNGLTLLGNGLLGWATGRPMGERSGLENDPCTLGWQRIGVAQGCQDTLAAAAARPGRYQLARHVPSVGK
jgi:hypothetical protein